MSPKVNVLLIERDPNVRQALGEALASESYGVALAASGGDAVRHLQQRADIHVIVMDLPLGASYGWQQLDRLRRTLPTAPVIVLASAPAQAETHGGRPGVAVLEKPLDLPLLFQTLRTVAGQPAHAGSPPNLSAACLT